MHPMPLLRADGVQLPGQPPTVGATLHDETPVTAPGAVVRDLSVTWTLRAEVEPDFYNVRFVPEGDGTHLLRCAAERTAVVSLPSGSWAVDVQAGLTLAGGSGLSDWSEAERIELVEPPPAAGQPAPVAGADHAVTMR